MKDQRDARLATSDLPEIVRKIRARTPARLLAGRAGAAYRTTTQLDLREAHAAARDAVRAELNAERAFGKDFVNTWNLFEASTNAVLKDQYLLRPELGRHFDGRSREELQRRCSSRNDLQIAIGDGLSVSAVAVQVPLLLPLIIAGAGQWHWKIGQTFVIHHCRVGILNEIGELLNPRVALLLIGERPGLATAESLSAYLAHLPNKAHTDADRNVISNIHLRGLNPHEAAARILSLAARMRETNSSGYQLKEAPPALGHP